MSADTNPEFTPVTIRAKGARLTARFTPAVGPTRANLVLHGATGVPQRYYQPFARWAAQRGVGVLTYDYRDFGASRTGPMRDSRANFADWTLHDQGAAERCLAELAPDGPLWVLGHSLGGLGIAFRQFDPRVSRITTIGAGMAHHTDHPWSYRPIALAFWFVLGPVGTALAGYLPGRRMLLGADLPAGVYWQWRRWCTRRRFFHDDIGDSLPQPDFTLPGPRIRMLTMTDDVVVPPVAVRRYADAFAAGRVDFAALDPADYGLTSLRHIEVLSQRSAAAWPAILDLPPA
ncbi:alpha/beta hydrolase family protein [Actibacterium ureilyticum]|uniref:alpha/beta hydrolase family protein n=1 Tax=Actibacterium ureilyticum TaxID=1590614 RepID=UPI000BAAB631|nr:alpha/beta fold hydrolase [Actibacterium ureilyticum]